MSPPDAAVTASRSEQSLLQVPSLVSAVFVTVQVVAADEVDTPTSSVMASVARAILSIGVL